MKKLYPSIASLACVILLAFSFGCEAGQQKETSDPESVDTGISGKSEQVDEQTDRKEIETEVEIEHVREDGSKWTDSHFDIRYEGESLPHRREIRVADKVFNRGTINAAGQRHGVWESFDSRRRLGSLWVYVDNKILFSDSRFATPTDPHRLAIGQLKQGIAILESYAESWESGTENDLWETRMANNEWADQITGKHRQDFDDRPERWPAIRAKELRDAAAILQKESDRRE